MVEDNGSDHATWMVEGSKMSESATTWGFPRPTRWDKEKESKSHKETTQILESNLTFNFNIQLEVSLIKHRHFSAYEHNNICEERQQLRVENKDKQLGTSGGT